MNISRKPPRIHDLVPPNGPLGLPFSYTIEITFQLFFIYIYIISVSESQDKNDFKFVI